MSRLKIVILVLGPLLASICNARAVDDNLLDLFPGAPIGWNITVEKRQSGEVTSPDECNVPCAPNNCGGESCLQKRSFVGQFMDFNGSDPDRHHALNLQKRYLNAPRTAGTISTYLEMQSENSAINRICPTGSISGFSYCLQQEFSTAPLNDNSQWLAGTANTLLEGCTVLVVASSRGVYMCHFYEDINYWPVQYRRPQQGFSVILDLIENGAPSTYATGPALNTGLFTGMYDNSWAFIMTPRNRQTLNDATSQAYSNQYNQLTALIRRLVPGIGILEYNYMCVPTVPDPNDPTAPLNYENAYQGVALFEYDSNADNNGNSDWRIWFEAQSEMGRKLGQNPPNGNPNA